MQRIQIFRSFTAIFWLGFFMAISFMEAPLKFTVPSISLAQGVTIGRVVFSALNKSEWIFFLIILATCFLSRPTSLVTVLIVIAGIILVLETAWVLPLLDANAEKIIYGNTPSANNMHLTYVLLELAKIPVLLLIAWQSARKSNFYFLSVPAKQ